MTDRDTFAAAALTGLVGSKADLEDTMQGVCDSAYRWADAMLRERARNSAVDDCETVGPAPAADGTGWPTSGAGPTLTDEEREAIEDAAGICEEHSEEYDGKLSSPIAVTLRSLLERMK